ncbi:MAG TPA: VUT family protein, partial [Paenisporosarcina sp.]|nr:VUT family protein [Paenisporosarcina sp.]
VRCLIWFSQVCMLVFGLLILVVMHLPAPPLWHKVKMFEEVFDPVIIVALGTIVSGLFGSFINAFMISKWKVLIQGRLFWLRSLGSTAVGEGIFVILVVLIVFGWRTPWYSTFSIMYASYALKILYNILLVPISSLVVSYLKSVEGQDVYDTNTNFNPFKLSVA